MVFMLYPTLSLLKGIDIQTGNRSSCVGTMNLPSRSKRTPLVRIPRLSLAAQSDVETKSNTSREISMTVSSALLRQGTYDVTCT